MKKKRKIRINVNPRPHFEEFMRSTKRWACLVVHRRGGKTFHCVMKLGLATIQAPAPSGARENSPHRYAYIAPTKSQAKDITWNYIKDFFAKIPGVKINEAELTVSCSHNKATLKLYSGETYERMRGLYFDGVVIDEPEQIDPSAWAMVIRPCLSDYQGWATWIGTIAGPAGFYRRYEAVKDNPDWCTMYLKASESGIIPKEELDEIRSDPEVTEEAYLQEYELNPNVSVPGAIYLPNIIDSRGRGRISEHIDHMEGLPVYTSFDVGAPINTKCWFWQISGNRINYIRSVSGGGELDTPARWVDLLKDYKREHRYSYGVHFLPHDAEFTWLPQFKEAGFENVICLRKSATVWEPINEMKRIFSRIYINSKHCEHGLKALEHWKSEERRKGAYIENKPTHDWASHYCTAFGYSGLAIKYGHTVSNIARVESDATDYEDFEIEVKRGLKWA